MDPIETDTRHLILQAEYESLGASWVERSGWLLPTDFGDVHGELQAVRKGCGVIDKSYFGRIRVTGETARDFLHRMTSAPINDLTEGRGMETIVTTAEGRFVDWVTVYRTGDQELYLITGPGAAQPVIEHLQAYIFFKDHVEFEPVGEDGAFLQFSGPECKSVLREAFGVELDPAEPYRLQTVGDPGDGITITCMPGLTSPDGGLFFPHRAGETVWDRLQSVSQDWQPVGFQAYQIARISAGIPQYPAEINDRHIAPEAHLISPVDLDSCFAGQEVIARTINYDKIKQHLCQFEIAGASGDLLTTPADVYRGEQRIGELTSVIWSPEQESHRGLGYIRTRYLEENLSVEIMQEDRQLSGIMLRKTDPR